MALSNTPNRKEVTAMRKIIAIGLGLAITLVMAHGDARARKTVTMEWCLLSDGHAENGVCCLPEKGGVMECYVISGMLSGTTMQGQNTTPSSPRPKPRMQQTPKKHQ